MTSTLKEENATRKLGENLHQPITAFFSKTTELKKDKTDNKQANRELQTALRKSKSLIDQAMPEIVFLRVFVKLLATINDGGKEKETK